MSFLLAQGPLLWVTGSLCAGCHSRGLTGQEAGSLAPQPQGPLTRPCRPDPPGPGRKMGYSCQNSQAFSDPPEKPMSQFCSTMDSPKKLNSGDENKTRNTSSPRPSSSSVSPEAQGFGSRLTNIVSSTSHPPPSTVLLVLHTTEKEPRQSDGPRPHGLDVEEPGFKPWTVGTRDHRPSWCQAAPPSSLTRFQGAVKAFTVNP